MPTTTGSERRGHVRALQAFMTAGLGDREAIEAYQKQRQQSGQPKIPRSSMLRYMAVAHREWDKENDQPHTRWRSRAIANCRRAMRTAMSAVKIIVVDGKVEKHPAADIGAYIAASKRLDELVGIDNIEGRELRAAYAERVNHLLVEVVRDVIDDLPLRSRLLLEFRRRAARMIVESGHGELVLDADVVEAHQAPHLSNGHTNGHALPPPSSDTPPTG